MLAVAVVVVLAVAVGILSSQRAVPVIAPSPSPTIASGSGIPSPAASSTAAADAARSAAISRVTALSAEVQRVDYVDAKRMRWSDFATVTRSSNGSGDDRQVWVVAVSGEITPAFARDDRFEWAMFVLDASSSDVLGETAGSAGWPPFFGLLKDVAGSARPEPVVEPAHPSGLDDNVSCGVLSPGTILSGAGSGADELRPAVSAAYGVTPLFRFGPPSSGRPAYGTYVCGRFRPGAPMAGLVAYVQPTEPDYVPESALIPTPFSLPQACRYVGPPTSELNANQVAWLIDCGGATNKDAPASLGPAVIAQGWRRCGEGRTSASWTKDGRTLAIAASADSTASSTRLTLRASSICSGVP